MINKYLHLFYEILKINFAYSAYLNFRHFGFVGLLKMPVIIQYGSTISCKSKNGLSFLKPLKLNMLKIGYGNKIEVDKGGKLQFSGDKACFNKNNSVSVCNSGIFEIGQNFWANTNSDFHCKKRLKFGDDVLIGMHVLIMDTDYHPIFNKQKEIINPDRDILMGNKVWIGSNTTILKGTQIGNDIIIGAGSIVSGKLLEDNSIYCGNPVKHVKNDITWCITHPDFWEARKS